MSNSDLDLPTSVSTITSVEDKMIYLIGTAHVSKESVEDVKKTVDLVDPDTICVELCASRHKSLVQRDIWKKMNIFKIVKEKKSVFLLAQLILSSFYRRLGNQLDVKPGAEMIEGIKLAEQRGVNLVLADRNVEVTLKRVWGYLNFWNKLNMFSHLISGILISEKIDQAMVEELKNKDQLENIMDTFAQSFPQIKSRLIDERDQYLAQKIRCASGKKIVAVVGAGHIPGIKENITQDQDLAPLLELPPKSVIPAIVGWSIPVIILGLFIWGFFKGGTEYTMQSAYIWVLVNGTLSAVGAALALAHPLTILTSFIAAPLTSLNPMIGAGWVAGLMQAVLKKPTVKDMEDLPNAIATVKGFWTNPVSRILLVVFLASLGSALGTWIAGGWIAGRLFN